MKFSYKEKHIPFILRNFLNGIAILEKETPEFKVCVLSHDLIGRSFAVTGGYEKAGISAVKWLCNKNYINNATHTTFVDIGANIGTYSLALSKEFKSVLAFEPHPVVNKVLSLNKEINNLNNINIQAYGLSDNDYETKLFEPLKNIGGSSIENETSGLSYNIQLKHASAAINNIKNSVVSFIKIDIEGHEHTVLQGLKEVLIQDQPIVAFEANDTKKNQPLLEYMQTIGYHKFYALDSKPSIKNPILRILFLSIFGAKYQLKAVENISQTKYSLVFAIPNHINFSI